jgi:hypothetical protein
MARKVQKNLNLPLDVVEWLEGQENQSETVEDALREQYDL